VKITYVSRTLHLILIQCRLSCCRSSFDPAFRNLAGPDWTGEVCPAGHMCPERTYICETITYDCDKCKQRIAVGSDGARCTVCNWDICCACFKTKPILQAVQPSELGVQVELHPPELADQPELHPQESEPHPRDRFRGTLTGTKQLSLFESFRITQPHRSVAPVVTPQAPERLQQRQRLKLRTNRVTFKSVTPQFPLRESSSTTTPSSNDACDALVAAGAVTYTRYPVYVFCSLNPLFYWCILIMCCDNLD
jgi:hypothetical protein